ncbi:MerR family transcriptional regulator [Ureibacillus manganicus]|uniref:HTH merR-type domain-containing protein n=1 Tax=Ureibacillus manganicus DSM 26584 TaxID=1384049 RepID=A0A0A3I5W7_9BACL|nr:MerR family transcriptional regulator [Ureibacillus manganicus]KGR78900.1 hypothetical protein CD29_09510 [Ureibacillus manganicus DSM 26584]
MFKQNAKIQYTIQQVAELTGLSKQVIRKWEERYGLIQPERLDNGYRVYSYEEVELLQRMKELTNEGMTIKQAISILSEGTSQKNVQLFFEDQGDQKTNPYTKHLINQLLEEGSKGNEANVLTLLKTAHHSLSMNELIEDCIVPFLKEIGDRWSSGEWSEYQEAISSQTVRDFLASLRRDYQVKENAPIILGSCLPNERHEIPVHILLLQFLLLGYSPIMLGPSPAPTAIQSTVELKSPKIVLLSAITTNPFKDNFKMIKELDRFASIHPNTKFYLGGEGALQALKNHPLKNIHLVKDVQDIMRDLNKNNVSTD